MQHDAAFDAVSLPHVLRHFSVALVLTGFLQPSHQRTTRLLKRAHPRDLTPA